MKKFYLPALLMFFCIFPKAQNHFTNNGNIKFHNGSSIAFFGNYTNNGTITDSAQTITFAGTSSQAIAGTSASTFKNLVLNNTAGINLQQNIVIDNSLTLTSGPLNLNSQSITLNNSTAAAVTRTSGYIVSEQTNNSGKITWSIGNSLGLHTFPLGTSGGNYIPFSLNLTAGTIGNVTVSTYATAANNTPYPVSPVTVSNLFDAAGNDNSANVVDRFWQIDKDGASGTATLTFVAASSEIGILSNLTAQRWNVGTNGWDAPLPNQTHSSASVTVPNVSSFSPWTLSGNNTFLPIEILSFTATANTNDVDVKWTTASEINNDYFTVERSADGVNFEEIKQINGAGNSFTTLNYLAKDYEPLSGVSYYRLKQTDFNGDFAYTGIASVEFKAGNQNVQVFYNSGIESRLSGFINEKIEYSIYDMAGKQVYSELITTNETGSMTIKTNVRLPAAMYFVSFTTNTKRYGQKIIVE